MPIFTVKMVHPDGAGWNTHLKPHVDYLVALQKAGTLKASGPLRGTTLRTGFIVMEAADRAEIERIVAADPFAVENLIVELEICEWDPVFGAFHDISSR